jgi:hypothetical protein
MACTDSVRNFRKRSRRGPVPLHSSFAETLNGAHLSSVGLPTGLLPFDFKAEAASGAGGDAWHIGRLACDQQGAVARSLDIVGQDIERDGAACPSAGRSRAKSGCSTR